jgi:hypothetical protein
MLGDDKPDTHGHGDHEDRYGQESESEGSSRLLQRDGSKRPQHKSDEKADEPHHAVADAANAGRKDLGSQRRARTPESQEPETPGEAEDPGRSVRHSKKQRLRGGAGRLIKKSVLPASAAVRLPT